MGAPPEPEAPPLPPVPPPEPAAPPSEPPAPPEPGPEPPPDSSRPPGFWLFPESVAFGPGVMDVAGPGAPCPLPSPPALPSSPLQLRAHTTNRTSRARMASATALRRQ
ncbi:hypothetical protein DMH15_08940 [Streptomyces sp. WAC 06725]|nr:hypothetical protein DMH15_08940 [Streptomyces sp. WAC 06725]